MPRFSERIGAVSPRTSIQVESMSSELRNSLWNLFFELYEDHDHDYWIRVAKHVARFFRRVPLDELPYRDYDAREWLKEYFFGLSWHAEYDLTEFLVHNHREMTTTRYGDYRESSHRIDERRFLEAVNRILEREISGYRFVQGVLTPISNTEETGAIDDAVAAAHESGLLGAQQHIRAALELLGKKPTPDYRNAIKEAISAVESVAKQIVGADSATLDTALKDLSEKTEVHGALRSGFSKLYGYTSDESGIRHAILEHPNVGFAEAKYMIVSCSAFVNYLIQKAEAAGMLKIKDERTA